jgi:hypothetical protein
VSRREFIALLRGAAVAWPYSVIGSINRLKANNWSFVGWPATDPTGLGRFGGFSQGLQELGWAEGRNVSFEVPHVVAGADQSSALAASLLAAKLDVFVVTSAGLADVAHR